MNKFKFFMAAENRRNTGHTQLYQRFLRKAFGDDHLIVLAGHHFMCMPQTADRESDLKAMNEIPSADTALFDHELMTKVFGGKETAIQVMVTLAQAPSDKREAILESYLDELDSSHIELDMVKRQNQSFEKLTFGDQSHLCNEGLPGISIDINGTVRRIWEPGGDVG